MTNTTENELIATQNGGTTKKRCMALSIVLLILIIDQAIKIWVKTHMLLGEMIPMIDGADWAFLRFIENEGMAFGMDFVGTLMLCCFRLVAIGALIWAVWKVTKKPEIKWGFVVLLSMILAGAMGNILDNVFYGLIFTQPDGFTPSELVPMGQGYGEILRGRVVDMFYFPIIRTTWPSWMPLCGGEDFVFFSPIFNFADAAISTGGALIVVCYYKTLNTLLARKKQEGPKED